MNMGASDKPDRAGGPADLSRDASQPEALIPCAAVAKKEGMDGYASGFEPHENPYREAYEAWDAGWAEADKTYRAAFGRSAFP